MNLDTLLKNKLKKLSASPKKYRVRKKIPPEQKLKENMRYISKLVRLGEYIPDKRSHSILMNIAHREGYIDKKTLEILKEI